MPTSNLRIDKVSRSGYNQCVKDGCEPRTGSDFSALRGRTWSGNQRRARRRFNPPTACSSRTEVTNMSAIHQGLCSCSTTPAAYSTGPLGPGSGPFGESSSGGANELRLQSKALARFSSNAGLGVTLAETSGTLRSLGDRLTAVLSILRSLKKGDFRGALSTLHRHTGYNTTRAEARLKARPDRTYTDRVSSFWLETTFGWVPLLQSIYDSLEALDRDFRTDRRSRASDSRNGLKVGVVAEFRTTASNRFSLLGITNPAEIAWDLVPFSFVLDWFVPIADSIRFLGTRSLTTQIWMWSSRTWGTREFTSSYLGAPEGVKRRETIRYSRSVSIPSVSTFTARLPATMWHAVTSAALIQGLRPR